MLCVCIRCFVEKNIVTLERLPSTCLGVALAAERHPAIDGRAPIAFTSGSDITLVNTIGEPDFFLQSHIYLIYTFYLPPYSKPPS